jgi:hemolysin activation/secretion protein
MPEPVPKLVEPEAPIAQTALEEQAALFEAMRQEYLGASGGETVILPALKGIILLKDEAQVDTVSLSPDAVSNLADYPDWDSADFRGLVDAFVGLPVSKESVDRLQSALRIQLSMMGRPFSIVYSPPQDITDGTLQFVIKESVTGEIRVEGAEHFSDQSYLSRIKQQAGQPIDAIVLREGIDRINSNSFRSAAAQVQPGVEPGTTDIIIQARDRFPLRVFAGYNNTGSETTTHDRMFTGFNWGNAFGLGHLMTLQWTSDFDVEHSKALSGNYTADLWHNHSVTVFGAYSEIVSVPSASGVAQEGTSWQAGLNYGIPLQPIGQRYTHSVQLGFDYKSSDNNLEIAIPPFIIPISDNLTHVAQFRAQYSGQLTDNWGNTSAGVRVTFSPGGLGSENDDAAFNATRAFAEADYIYGNLNLSRNTNLRGFLQDWNWTMRGEWQMASGNLLGSEQFSAGGSGSVRGYEESEVVGDNALFFSQELLLPIMTPAKDLFDSKYPDSLRLFVFHDYARTWNVDKLPGEKPFNLQSMGAGLNYQFSTYASLRFAYGWQLKDSGSSSTGDNSRAHVSFQVSY